MAQDPKAEAGAEAPKKSSKKLIVIIAAVVALAAGGGGAAFFMMKGKSDHKKEAAEEVEHVADPVYLKMDTFTLNLNPEDGEKYLQVDITISASNQEEADLLTKNMPMVKNRIVLLLTSKKAGEISSAEGKEALAKELTAKLNEPFVAKGKPQKISGVLFTSFVIQ